MEAAMREIGILEYVVSPREDVIVFYCAVMAPFSVRNTSGKMQCMN
jgi:hypothetical protein